MKRLLSIILLILIPLVGAAPAWPAPGVGEKAPSFVLRELDDAANRVDSRRLFQGRTTLLSFFATWCKPCEKEIPELRALAERYADRGFQVVLVSLDHLEEQTIIEFLEEAGAGDLKVLWDEQSEMMALYQVMHLPTNILVDPSEAVAMAWQGYLPEKVEELRAYLHRLPKPSTATPGDRRSGGSTGDSDPG